MFSPILAGVAPQRRRLTAPSSRTKMGTDYRVSSQHLQDALGSPLFVARESLSWPPWRDDNSLWRQALRASRVLQGQDVAR